MLLVYLSAPYSTGPDTPAQRQADIDKATAWLMRNTGVYIFSPITYEKPLKDIYRVSLKTQADLDREWDFWRPLDAEMVSRSDAVWVLCLRNWENSRGVNFEINEARRLGKPVRYVHPEEIMEPCPTCAGTGELICYNNATAPCVHCKGGRRGTGAFRYLLMLDPPGAISPSSQAFCRVEARP